jgi:trehalose utilization protein
MKSRQIVVWGENVHEQRDAAVQAVYPQGMHTAIAAGVREHWPGAQVDTVTLQEPEHGLSEARLAATDVLIWWGHRAHAEVDDAIVERVQRRVWEGMGLVVLHSGHFSKIFRRLLGTTCSLKWRVAGERERIWVCDPGHPIARGLPPSFDVAPEEMYGEPFDVPAPDELVLLSWFEGGEVFRSGCCWRRGRGRIFYFRPGHELYPTYFNPHVRLTIANGARWAAGAGE